MRNCTHCQTSIPLVKNVYLCRACKSSYEKQRYRMFTEEKRARMYEYNKRYHKTHKDQERLRAGKYRLKHRERINKYTADYYRQHKERRLLSAKSWAQSLSPERRLNYAMSRYAKLLQRCYGIDETTANELLKQREGRCAICNKSRAENIVRGKPMQLHFDHDHATNIFRGFLCNKCNLGLGLFGDSPQLLIAAAQYLHQSREKPSKIIVSRRAETIAIEAA